MEQENIAEKLARRFFTRDPFTLARSINRIVIEAPLVGVRGYYQQVKKNHILYVDSRLEGFERQFVCAHELGHSILHPHLNSIFLDSRTQFRKAKYEQEADRFALDLLIPDEQLAEFINMPAQNIAEMFGVNEDLIRQKVYQMKIN